MPFKKHLYILYFFWYVFVFCAMDKSGTKDYNRVYETVSVPRETVVILKTAQQILVQQILVLVLFSGQVTIS